MTKLKEDKFKIALEFAFGAEGGYNNDEHDSGGPTMMGITIATLSNWRKKSVSEKDVKALTKQEAIEIYREFYWKHCRCDEMPTPIACMVFDFAINSGTPRAVMVLQSLLGVVEDGVAGKKTLSAVCAVNTKSLIDAYYTARVAFLKTLRNWEYFKRGWKDRNKSLKAYAHKLNKEMP